MAEHTPTPWERTDGEIWVDTREQVCCGRGYDQCCGEPDIRGGQELIAQSNPADAAFIVESVNAYEPMKVELESLRAKLREAEESKSEIERLNAVVRALGFQTDLDAGFIQTICQENKDLRNLVEGARPNGTVSVELLNSERRINDDLRAENDRIRAGFYDALRAAWLILRTTSPDGPVRVYRSNVEDYDAERAIFLSSKDLRRGDYLFEAKLGPKASVPLPSTVRQPNQSPQNPEN
jgi:hypothetical protein